LTDSYEAPRNDLERVLAEIWQELLGVDRVGIRDNFFALGGDSLTALRMLGQIKRKCGIDLKVKTVFTHLQLAQLADHIKLVTTNVSVGDIDDRYRLLEI